MQSLISLKGFKIVDELCLLNFVFLRCICMDLENMLKLQTSRRWVSKHEWFNGNTFDFFFNSFLASEDPICEDSSNAEVIEITLDKLKSLVDLRPQVIEDFSTIFEKFPHTNMVSELLYSFVSAFIVNCDFSSYYYYVMLTD